MAPLVLTRAGSAPRAARGAAPSVQEPEESVEGPALPTPESAEGDESAPPAGAGAGPVRDFLAGQYYYISTSSYGSTERYIDMCSDGRCSSRTGTYSTGDAGTGYGEGGQSAQWTAEGDESQGVIVVTNSNGETERYEYRRSGSDLIVNNRTFARYGDGSCTKTSPF